MADSSQHEQGDCGGEAREAETALFPMVRDLPVSTSAPGSERPGLRVSPFVDSWLKTPVGPVPRVRTRLGLEEILGRWKVRWGIDRYAYRVAPGLYAVGNPDRGSPVIVTANYKLTFDAVRSELGGVDAWILVLDTRGINVWCAAGKGTFGTDEVVRRVKAVGLESAVEHRALVLPQLSASGVAAHEVKAGCGFSVVYGPVRARDIREFLAEGLEASPEMRRVTFGLWDRLILTPVELANMARPSLWVLPALVVLGGIGPGVFSVGGAWRRGFGAIAAYVAGVLAGTVVTPILLPWLPGRAFSYKGAVVGAAASALGILLFWSRLGWADVFALVPGLAVLSSYCAMLFTGSTTFTSPSGVEKEMRKALPYQLLGLGFATVVWVGSRF